MYRIRPSFYVSNKSEEQSLLRIAETIKKIGLQQTESLLFCQASKAETINTEETSDTLSIDIDATTINTKEKLIEAAKVDLSVWDVSGFRVSTWQQKENGVQLFAVRATFTRKIKPSINELVKIAKEAFKSEIKPFIKTSKKNYDAVCAIPCIFDAHLGKVSRLEETGTEVSSIKEQIEELDGVFDLLLSNLDSPEKIILPIGNDLFNVNDSGNTTKKGTHQDSYMNHVDVFSHGLSFVKRCIDKCLHISKDVHVVPVLGNHAWDLEAILAIAVQSTYQGVSGVSVDASRFSRKYASFGENMFMLHHGDKLKKKLKEIPTIMQHDNPELFYKSKEKFAIFGDIHHMQLHELTGVKAWFLGAMSPPDQWHHNSGYLCKKQAHLLTFSKDAKENNLLTINV